MEGLIISVIHRTCMAGTSLLLGTTGEILTERSGILNLGVDGMMNIGAVTGFIVTYTTGNVLAGVLAALLTGAISAAIHGIVSIYFKANQTVSGLALSMLGVGLAGVMGKPYIGKQLPVKLEPVQLPLLGKIPLLGDLLFNQDLLFYAGLLLAVAAWFFLKWTRLGIRVRSVGENPEASESQGISVRWIRFFCTVAGGAFAGLGGAHISLAYSTSWIEGLVAGRGWIVVGLTIFSLWNPLRGIGGAFLFGGIFITQYMLQPLGVPPNLLATLPYGATLIVLLVDGLRKDHRSLHAPAQLGEPYSR
ncbi:MAG TPA: ABC transporter permease [Spirochaetales bacterium]|nr:ABC transporter permease [Spirochaetales bacterium]HOV37452.1 ABC transporter permease [Spirochaetales bacterium]